jgi:integrase
MKRKRLPLPTHPLTKFFRPAAESVTTSLGDSSVTSYRATVRLFLTYLGAHYPAVRSLDQLRRDPHILGWLAFLRSHNPPLATITRANYVIYLRRMLEELAWTEQLPALAHLLGRDDVPRKERHLPRPLTPEQDQLIQQELLRRNDLLSNALLLIRHTGMRIGECIDLSVDCLCAIGPDRWAIHVPLGKLKTERLVPVDSLVCQLVERLRSMRSPNAPSTGRLLLSQSRGQYMLVRKLRNTLRDVATAAGIGARIVPHQMRHTSGWPDRLARGHPACFRDVPPQPCRRRPAPSRSPCTTSRQDPRRRQETQPASKIGKDWPVKSGCGKLQSRETALREISPHESARRLQRAMPDACRLTRHVHAFCSAAPI